MKRVGENLFQLHTTWYKYLLQVASQKKKKKKKKKNKKL